MRCHDPVLTPRSAVVVLTAFTSIVSVIYGDLRMEVSLTGRAHHLRQHRSLNLGGILSS
jgi:hypothetical protein